MEPLVIVGVDIGQKVDPTAICVCEVERRELEPSRMEFPKRGGLFESNDMIRIPAKVEEVYVARHVGRLALGTSYPDIARHIADLIDGLVKRGISRPRIIVDSTGVGAPVVDILREALKGRARDLRPVSSSGTENLVIEIFHKSSRSSIVARSRSGRNSPR